MAATPPICDFGWKAPEFRLPATDGKTYTLANIRGRKGTLIAFICNHCPYVKSAIGRLARDARDLQAIGIGVAAISSNDASQYPEDSFEKMKSFAVQHGFTFPYLYDEAQVVARAYDAVCTPEIYLFDKEQRLVYHGGIDDNQKNPEQVKQHYLADAIQAVLNEAKPDPQLTMALGCTIKWK